MNFKSYKENDYNLNLESLITCNNYLFIVVGEVGVELKCHFLSLEKEDSVKTKIHHILF